jgi:hypothetical protein
VPEQHRFRLQPHQREALDHITRRK